MDRFYVAALRFRSAVIVSFVFTAFIFSLDRQARPGDVETLFLISLPVFYVMCTPVRMLPQHSSAWPTAIPPQPVAPRQPTVSYALWDRDLDG